MKKSFRRNRKPAWLIALLCGAFAMQSEVAQADTLIVTNTLDAGAGSLRQAISSANAAAGDDAIFFDLAGAGPHTIDLTTALPAISSNVSIVNNSEPSEIVTVRRSTVAGTANFRIFAIASGATANISGITISNGIAFDQGSLSALGGAIRNDGTLSVTSCTFSNNKATGAAGVVSSGSDGRGGDAQGGAIYNSSTLTVNSCIFNNNTTTGGNGTGVGKGGAGQGGAIYNSSNATGSVTGSTFNNNIVTAGNGNTAGVGQGGAIRNSGSLTFAFCSFQSNSASNFSGDAQGGGIYNSATLSATGCNVSGNNANSQNKGVGQGGGIRNSGTLTLIDSSLSTNLAFGGNAAQAGPGVGGGLYNSGGATVRQCTINNNAVEGGDSSSGQGGAGLGGGIYNSNSASTVLTFTNSTLSGNRTTGGASSNSAASASLGGGLFMEGNGSGAATLTAATVALNNANDGTGILASGGTLTLKNTIVASNAQTVGGPSFHDVRGAVSASSQYNLIGDGSDLTGITAGTGGNQIGGGSNPIIDAKLGPLQDNGGSTKTHALLVDSPAIDKGSAFGLTTDQRGATRPYDNESITNAAGGDASDIGAFEFRPAPPPVLNISDVTVTEGSGTNSTATFNVTLSAASTQTVTVTARTTNGPATAPADFTATANTLTFAPGQTSKTFSVPVIGDNLDENNEQFYVLLSSPSNATIFKGRGTATITDDDATPSVSISDAVIREGDSGQRVAVFRLTLSAPSGRVVTVFSNTQDGTATASSDYTQNGSTAAPARVDFSTGSTVAYIRVFINGDELNEVNETFRVNLTGVGNATLTDNQAIGTILNDDSAPALTISDAQVTEGNSGSKNLAFTVTLSKASGQTVSVNFATANGGAKSTSDYVAQSGTVNFAPGTLSQTINVVINGDTLVEDDELLYVLLSNAVNASIGRGRGIGVITNDDASG